MTEDLLSIIRQQRHLGTRVLIATQEPTLSPKLIDLVNATFVHRFLSPSWYKVLEQHLAGASKDGRDEGSLFNKIMSLRTGEALLFCPTAQLDVAEDSEEEKEVKILGNSYAKIKIRKRLTADGGKSMMATETLADTKAHAAVNGVPMHLVVPQQKGEKGNNTDKEDPDAKTATVKKQTGTATPAPTTTPTNNQAAPKPSLATSNRISIPAKGPAAVEWNRKLKTAFVVRAREMFQKDWSSFKPLTESQIAQLCSAVDASFNIQPGSTARIDYAKGQCLNKYLVSLTPIG